MNALVFPNLLIFCSIKFIIKLCQSAYSILRNRHFQKIRVTSLYNKIRVMGTRDKLLSANLTSF